MKLKPTIKKQRAFTLIELLVVISIITLLMAVFGISANKINQVARNLKQKAQMHSMEVGLELFLKDFGDYPDSYPTKIGSNYVYGAQHMTEALFGRDLGGIESASKFHGEGDGEIRGIEIPDYYNPYSEKSKNRRKGPYVQMKEGGVDVVYMSYGDIPLYSEDQLSAGDIYTDTDIKFNPDDKSTQYYDAAPVVVDVFRQKKIDRASGNTTYVGTPVLYFKANRGSKIFDREGPSGGASVGSLRDWTYNYFDNNGFYDLPSLRNPEDTTNDNLHHFDGDYVPVDTDKGNNGMSYFYDYIANKKIDAFDQAHNPQGFLLISAGRDGIYGTKDDVTNFER
jgi:prepilin-type N-terminal cleavage/methylation domain-containing protein